MSRLGSECETPQLEFGALSYLCHRHATLRTGLKPWLTCHWGVGSNPVCDTCVLDQDIVHYNCFSLPRGKMGTCEGKLILCF